jgi:hypothetical protein
MKKRNKILRYSEGELVDDDDLEAQKVYNADLEELSDEERMPRSMAPVMRKAARTASARRSAVQSRERAAAPGREPPSMTESPRNAITGAGAAMDRNALTGSYRRMSDEARSGAKGRPMTEREQKAASAAGLAATLVPASRVAKGVYDVGKAANTARRMGNVVKKYDAEKTAAAGERASRLAEFEAKKAARRGGRNMEGRMGVVDDIGMGYKRGGKVKKYASGGSVSSASKRADGIAVRGKTRGRIF